MAYWSCNNPSGPSSSPVRFDVVFVLPHMGRGGAQRVTSLVANAWSRQGKRICIVTWDDNKEQAHELDNRIVRVEMSGFTREIVFRGGVIRHAQVEIRHYLREIERWLRSRWPWRRGDRRASSLTFSSTGARYFPDSRPWWSLRPVQRAIAVLAVFADRRRRKSAFFDKVFFISRASLSLLVLGYRVRAFREMLSELRSPVVVSLLAKTNLYVLEAARGIEVRVVISERNDPDLQEIDPGLAALRRLIYREADAVTSNSSGILDKLAAYVPAGKLKLMQNPILAPSVEKDNVSKSSRFIAVARLVHQKGIDLLLEAFAVIADDVRNWHLEIVGDGPLRTELAVRARKLGIDNRVTFHGHLPDPMTILRLSRVFVLPSRFEGMPNALLEAMACGLAPIVTDASPGPLESVKHNESGLVVRSEDVSALAEAMRLLASDDGMTDRLAEQAGAYIKKHDWSVIEPQWLQVLGIGADEGATKPLNLLFGDR